jgi:hypothetical protein
VSLLLAALWVTVAQAAQTVTLTWDANPAPGIAGYRVHYGVVSGVYSQISDVGNKLTATIFDLTAGKTYFFAVTAYDAAGLESSPSNEVSYTAGMTNSRLFNGSVVPSIITANDPSAVELGVKFQSSVAGNITAIRFYKGPQNTGPHTAHLWNASGTLLASATFLGETVSGWQQVNLPAPVAIAANTTYVASYHCKGYYSIDANYFATAHLSGPLLALASGSSGGNGVYAYGTTSTFPTNTYNASNYWVDVVVATKPPPTSRTRRLKRK